MIICLAAAVIGVLLSSAKDDSSADEEDKTIVPADEAGIFLPEASRGDTAKAVITNEEGVRYEYTIFRQDREYDNYADYISAHGCSTCALTTILRATVPELKDLTPDKTIEEVIRPAAGDAFTRNFGKSMRRQMPVTLSGMTRIFDKYGVEYKRPSEDPDKRVKEVKEWLRGGDPVILTFGNASEAHLSRHTHTVLLLGIGEDGKVIIGDSLLKSRTHWGRQGLIKTGGPDVKDMISYIRKTDGWTVCNDKAPEGRIFYKDSADRGYLLIRKKGE